MLNSFRDLELNYPHRDAIKDAIKSVLARGLSLIGTPIIVNSFGRSGSTVLYESVCTSASRLPFAAAQKIPGGAAWSLEHAPLRQGRCYKTHDYPPGNTSIPCRSLYVFGDPVEASVSAYERARSNPEWLSEHCGHLRVEQCDTASILARDALQMGPHLRAWLEQTRVPTLFVRYERMWEEVQAISNFMGFPVTLPPRLARKPHSLNRAQIERLQVIHADTRSLVSALPDYLVKGE